MADETVDKRGKRNAYFLWGINDKTYEITGTTINYQRDVKNEPFQHYLARSVSPDTGFTFKTMIRKTFMETF